MDAASRFVAELLERAKEEAMRRMRERQQVCSFLLILHFLYDYCLFLIYSMVKNEYYRGPQTEEFLQLAFLFFGQKFTTSFR